MDFKILVEQLCIAKERSETRISINILCVLFYIKFDAF